MFEKAGAGSRPVSRNFPYHKHFRASRTYVPAAQPSNPRPQPFGPEPLPSGPVRLPQEAYNRCSRLPC